MIIHYSLSFLRYQQQVKTKQELNKVVKQLQRMGKTYYFDDKYSVSWFYVTCDDGVTIVNPVGRKEKVDCIKEPVGVKMYGY